MNRILRPIILAMAALALLASGVLATGSIDNPNNETYWEARYPNAVECYKYGERANNTHGRESHDRKSVILNPFQSEWPGDRWEVLIVKGGSVNGNTGLRGQNVYDLPTAGVNYYPPLNHGGNRPNVSHWIVCKGQSPEATPTPTPTPSVPLDIGPFPTPTPTSPGLYPSFDEIPSESPAPVLLPDTAVDGRDATGWVVGLFVVFLFGFVISYFFGSIRRGR